MRVAAIVAAGGRGIRLGGGTPKQFLDLGDGTPMVARSIDALRRCALVDEIVVAVPGDLRDEIAWPAGDPPVRVVAGGERRQDSVANALAAISAEADVIVIHDAARPFVSPALVARTIEAARTHGAAIAALAVSDTVKQSHDDGRAVRVTLPRETIFLAQTPQAFRRDLLIQALAAAGETIVTDEAALIERAGFPVRIVEGERTNIKVTTREDLEAARAAARASRGVEARVGTGYDLHRLIENRPLILAGVRVPFDRGLAGHSDADLVCHAVTDAVLGAAGAGDIGRLFPDTAPEWKDADSLHLLRRAVQIVHAAGFRVANADVTVIAERPKLLPYLETMRANLAGALGTEVEHVSIKGKTNEGVDAVGRGEAMACHAVALVVRS